MIPHTFPGVSSAKARILTRSYENPPEDCSPSSTISRPKPLILCLEDNPKYLALRKKVLERDGYEVISVTIAGEVVKALHEFPICATIADHLLQGATGAQLARDMKKIKPKVPIILVFRCSSGKFRRCGRLSNKGGPAGKFLENSASGGGSFPFIVSK